MGLYDRSLYLARLVLAELASVGVTGSDIVFQQMSEPVPFQLQATPIHPIGVVGGVAPTLMSESGLFRLPSTTSLWELYTKALLEPEPEKHLDRYKGRAGLAEPFGLKQWSPLIFSVPEAGDPTAGAVFALEMATVLRSLGMGRMATAADTYLVRMPDGHEYGIAAGLPTFNGDYWSANLGKHVSTYLSAPRGQTYEAQGFNVIDRLTHWLYLNSAKVPDTESCLAALTPLRLTGTAQQLYDFEQDMYRMKPGSPETLTAVPLLPRQRIELLDEALKVLERWLLDDRQKMIEIFELIVPHCCTEQHFMRRIASIETMPTMMNKKQLARAEAAIRQLYSTGQP